MTIGALIDFIENFKRHAEPFDAVIAEISAGVVDLMQAVSEIEDGLPIEDSRRDRLRRFINHARNAREILLQRKLEERSLLLYLERHEWLADQLLRSTDIDNSGNTEA